MICFGLDGTEEQHYELLSHLKMIVHAVSLGDGESLIVYNSKNGENGIVSRSIPRRIL